MSYNLPVPTQTTYTSVIASYVIQRTDITPNTSAYITVQLYDSNGGYVANMNMMMEGEAYQLWTNDDYLLAWIAEQIYLQYPIPQ